MEEVKGVGGILGVVGVEGKVLKVVLGETPGRLLDLVDRLLTPSQQMTTQRSKAMAEIDSEEMMMKMP